MGITLSLSRESQPVQEETPVHEVTEGDMMHLTVEKPATVKLSEVKILKNTQPLYPTKNIQVQSTSPTTIDIKFSPVELVDQGHYSLQIRDQVQPIMQLIVREKPVQRQLMSLPQDTFVEGETLTIECKFDSKPDTQFVWTKDGSILLNDSRIILKQKNEAFTLVIKDLKPSDQGVYSLESKYLILDTPFINVLPKQPTVQVQHEETNLTVQVNLSLLCNFSFDDFRISSPMSRLLKRRKKLLLLSNHRRKFNLLLLKFKRRKRKWMKQSPQRHRLTPKNNPHFKQVPLSLIQNNQLK